MKTGFRPQYYRIRRMVQMVREGADSALQQHGLHERVRSRAARWRGTWTSCNRRRAAGLRRRPARVPADRRDLHAAAGENQPQGAFSFGLARKLLGPLEGHTPCTWICGRYWTRSPSRWRAKSPSSRTGSASTSASCPRTGCGSTPMCGRRLAGFIECREVILNDYNHIFVSS